MFVEPFGEGDRLASEDVLELESGNDAVGDLLLPLEVADAELQRFLGLVALSTVMVTRRSRRSSERRMFAAAHPTSRVSM
jgi:hypothetical protein